MAVMNVTYMSRYLKRYVDVRVILPIEDTKKMKPLPKRIEPFPTLYLLHGFSGCCSDWLYGSRIFKIARDLKLAVVMPGGENHFYVDRPELDMMYGSFVGEELVDATRKMFPLSPKREDTFIGGLSMGGIGSVLVGSRHAETFGGILSLSAPLLFDDATRKLLPVPEETFTAHFGERSQFDTSMNNPLYAASVAQKAGNLPPIFSAVGTEDVFFESCRAGAEQLKALGADVTFVTDYGAHEWTFWDKYIEVAIHWYLDEVRANGKR